MQRKNALQAQAEQIQRRLPKANTVLRAMEANQQTRVGSGWLIANQQTRVGSGWLIELVSALSEDLLALQQAEPARPIPAEWADAANSARGLCESEAKRWETASPSTAEHWRSVSIRLGALYLGQDSLSVVVPPHEQQAEPSQEPLTDQLVDLGVRYADGDLSDEVFVQRIRAVTQQVEPAQGVDDTGEFCICSCRHTRAEINRLRALLKPDPSPDPGDEK